MRLTPEQLAEHLDTCSARGRELVLALRDLILDAAPNAEESIGFNSLCYSVPDAPFGVIGGNVCAIGVRDDLVSLAFLQGAGLPDPTALLTGSAKAKREVPITSLKAARDPALRALICASHEAALRRCDGAS